MKSIIKVLKTKRNISVIIVIIGMIFTACQKDSSTICKRLAKQGTADITALKGEWGFEYFAYSANGQKIKNENAIQKGYINITDTCIWFYYTNELHYKYFLEEPNYISPILEGSTYINPPQEEIEIADAFDNSKCYVVKDDKLFIHYTENDKGNILILNKK